MDNIERMVRIVTREAEKVMSERDNVAADRDAWRERAERAERAHATLVDINNHMNAMLAKAFNASADFFGVPRLDAETLAAHGVPEDVGDYSTPAPKPIAPVVRRRRRRRAGGQPHAEPLGGITDEIAQAIDNAPGKSASLAPAKPKAAPIAADNLDADQRAILAALTPEWQTVLQLHKSAVEHGFSKGNQTVRNYMLRNIVLGPHGANIETQESPLAWRLKGTPSEGGDTIKTPDADDKAPVAPEPSPNAMPEPVKLYGRLKPADRLKRDRLLLEALGEEGKTFQQWRSEVERRGGDLGFSAQLTLEAAQQRLKDEYIRRNHFGAGATFWVYPTLKEALAKFNAQFDGRTHNDA